MRRAAVALCAVVQLAGCSTVVSGEAVQAPPSLVAQAMPSLSELGQLVGAPMRTGQPIEVGGVEVLRDDTDDITPAECAALVHAGIRYVYGDAPVRAAARGIWSASAGAGGVPPTNLSIAVVELDTAESASTWFDDTAAQWQQCQGQTVTQPMDGMTFKAAVTHADTTDGFATATMTLSTADGTFTATPFERTITTTSRYVVDVDVLGSSEPAGTTSDTDIAVGAARLVAEKIAGTE